MRKWKKKAGAPPRPPRVTLHEETAPLLARLTHAMKRDPKDVIHFALRVLAVVYLPKAKPNRAEPKGRGGDITGLPVKSTFKKLTTNERKDRNNAYWKP